MNIASSSTPQRVALIGPGAIGCTVLAHLSKSPGLELQVCARTPFERIDVDTPGGPITTAPVVWTSPDAVSAVDWVLVATKTYDVEGAAKWLPRLLRPGTRVAVLQNGVEHRARFARWVAPEALVPVIVDCPAERLAPGVSRQRGPARQQVPDDEAGRAYAALFHASAVATETCPDWTTAAWRKLCINSPGAVSALALKPSGMTRNSDVAEVMREMIREVIAVGRAEGATLPDNVVEQVIASYQAAPADSLNSLHADRAAGRAMEWDARNGVVVRLGKRHGIPTPLNALAAAVLRAAYVST